MGIDLRRVAWAGVAETVRFRQKGPIKWYAFFPQLPPSLLPFVLLLTGNLHYIIADIHYHRMYDRCLQNKPRKKNLVFCDSDCRIVMPIIT